MKSSSRYIQFEVETRMAPFGIFGGGSSDVKVENNDSDDGDYEVATEDDIMQLAKILGGG